MTTITADRLRELLDYEAETGLFRWRAAPSNCVKSGCVAGCISNHRYRVIRVDGRRYYAGRLAWLYMVGDFPKNDIDHKNGAMDDNRFANLRDVTNAQNLQNRRHASRDNKTGLLGVTQSQGQFQAQITLAGTNHFLGRYKTPEEAHEAYLMAKRKLHEFCTI